MGININDTITVIAPDGTTYPMKIIGTFNTGDHRSDERVLYTSMKTAQNILRSPGFVSRIVVKIKDVSKAQEIATLWQATSMDDVESWDQANQNFLSMTDTQDMVRTITTMTFILVVSFGIYNILNMVVSHKKREIAILRSIGFDEKDTIFLFLIQGALISIVGAGLGLIIGFGISLYIESVKIPMGRGFMRVSFDASIYLKSFLLVFGSSIIASFFPARAAGKLSPIEIIKGTS